MKADGNQLPLIEGVAFRPGAYVRDVTYSSTASGPPPLTQGRSYNEG